MRIKINLKYILIKYKEKNNTYFKIDNLKIILIINATLINSNGFYTNYDFADVALIKK
jgi:hypothetical protein